MTGSQYLSATQLRGLEKVGDVLIPGDDEFPSFSQSGSSDHADRMFGHMYEADRDALKGLLRMLRFLPRPLIRLLLLLTEQHRFAPGPIASTFRLINVGLKGVVMTLYYSDLGSGISIHELIRYDAKIVEREPDPEHASSEVT